MNHVVVRVGGSRFAIPMGAIGEVGRVPVVTRVPGLPAWATGVVNWRGRILAIVDLATLLGLDGGEGRDTRVVVLNDDGVTLGVRCDRVDGVLEIDLDALEPALLTLPGEAGALLAGQITDADGPVGVIDTSAVFALRTRITARKAG